MMPNEPIQDMVIGAHRFLLARPKNRPWSAFDGGAFPTEGEPEFRPVMLTGIEGCQRIRIIGSHCIFAVEDFDIGPDILTDVSPEDINRHEIDTALDEESGGYSHQEVRVCVAEAGLDWHEVADFERLVEPMILDREGLELVRRYGPTWNQMELAQEVLRFLDHEDDDEQTITTVYEVVFAMGMSRGGNNARAIYSAIKKKLETSTPTQAVRKADR